MEGMEVLKFLREAQVIMKLAQSFDGATEESVHFDLSITDIISKEVNFAVNSTRIRDSSELLVDAIFRSRIEYLLFVLHKYLKQVCL